MPVRADHVLSERHSSLLRDQPSQKPRAPSRSGKRSEIICARRTAPPRSSSSAGSNRPQREPTSVISFTITGAVSIATVAVHGRFHDHGSARARHRHRLPQALGAIRSPPPPSRNAAGWSAPASRAPHPPPRRSASSPGAARRGARARRARCSTCAISSPSFPSPSTATGAPRGIDTWSRISHAAASGSVNTACSVARSSGTTCRLRSGQREELAERAGMLARSRAPCGAGSAARARAGTTRTRRTRRLISPTTRAPSRARACPPPPLRPRTRGPACREAVVAALQFEIGVADARRTAAGSARIPAAARAAAFRASRHARSRCERPACAPSIIEGSCLPN